MGFIGVDAGGTSWKAILVDDRDAIAERIAIPTTTPEATVAGLVQWIDEQRRRHDIGAVGLSCFGPIDRDPASADYGMIGTTTKSGWQGFNPRLAIAQQSGLACGLESDVNGALLAEVASGAGRGLSDVAYITVGTGVGGAAISDGKLVGAPYHGEFGHLPTRRQADDIGDFAGSCVFHGDCVEGMASATAIRARWQVEPHQLADNHPAWDQVTSGLTDLCIAITCLLAPQRIIIGGGLLQRAMLIGRIRAQFRMRVNGFYSRPEPRDAECYLSLPGLGDDAGAWGGVLMARQAADRQEMALQSEGTS